MAKCIRVQRKKTLVCSGSLNRKIDIYQRDLTAPLNPAGILADFREPFTLLLTTWAMIATPKGKTIFDSVTASPTNIDTVFTIRYTTIMDDDTQRWIVFNGKRYKIENVTNLEENSLYLQLDTSFTGLEGVEAGKV